MDVTNIVNEFNNDSITSAEMWDQIFEKINKPNRNKQARKRAQATRKEWKEFVKGTESIGRLKTEH